MLEHSHVHRQASILLLLPSEVVHGFVLICAHVEELRARIEIAHAVFAKTNVTIVRECAKDALSWFIKCTCIVNSELLHYVTCGVDLLIGSSCSSGRLDHFVFFVV